MAAKQKRAKPDAARRGAPDHSTVAGSGLAGTDTSFWAVDTSWTLLLVALVLTPLLITNLSWLPGTRSVWLHSGASTLKALVMQSLIGASLASFSLALIRRRAVLRWHRVAWLAVAYVVWSGITVVTSVSPATAFIGYPSNAEGWMALATYATAAFLTLQLADNPARIRSLLRVSALTATAVAIYGLVQTGGMDPLKWQASMWGAFRSFGTIGNPDMFGAYMVLNLFVLLALALGESDVRLRIGYAAATLAVGLATYTSLTRASWLGAIAGAIFFAFFAVRLKVRFTRVEAVLAVVLVLAISGSTISSLREWDGDSNSATRLAAAFNPQDKNTLGRTETWRVAAIALAKRPVVGYGPDTFPLAFQPNKTERFARLVEPNVVQANAHSSLIQIAVERGVPGIALWLALIGVVVAVSASVVLRGDERSLSGRVLLAGVFASCAGYVATSLLTPSSHESSLLLWCMFAILVSPVSKNVAQETPKAIAAASLVFGLAAASVAVAFLLADVKAAVANDEAISAPVRMAAADAAVRLDPLNADYAAVAAKAYAQALPAASSTSSATVVTLFDKAYAQMHRAEALAPTDLHTRSTLVSLLLIGGARVDGRYYREAASVAAATAHDAPNDLESSYWFARALNAGGRGTEAIPVLERILAIQPRYPDAAILLSDLYVARGDKVAARALLVRTIPLVGDSTALKARLAALGAGTTNP